MPFFKNAKNEICQIYDNEVEPVVKAGWKELTAVEEDEYRALLNGKQELTSAVAIEEARVKAGLADVLSKVEVAAEGEAQKVVNAAAKNATRKPAAKKTPAPAAEKPAAPAEKASEATSTATDGAK